MLVPKLPLHLVLLMVRQHQLAMCWVVVVHYHQLALCCSILGEMMALRCELFSHDAGDYDCGKTFSGNVNMEKLVLHAGEEIRIDNFSFVTDLFNPSRHF